MTELAQLAERNVSSIFNERDGKKRRAALKDLWTADAVLWSAGGTYIGYQSIERAISSLLRSYPEFSFTLVGEVDEIPDAARMRWSFGAAGAPAGNHRHGRDCGNGRTDRGDVQVPGRCRAVTAWQRSLLSRLRVSVRVRRQAYSLSR